jgi:predicted amidohydrolase YtcJ
MAKTIKVTVSQQEFDTILAALRFWQKAIDQESAGAVVIDEDEFEAIHAIAAEHGAPLGVHAIGALIERTN